MKQKLADAMIYIALAVATMLFIFGIWFGSSWVEARAYNRITGSHVSTWDAMFVELRVQQGAK